MSHTFAIVIESLVAVLLLVTVAYCWLLNKRLLRLKADEASLKATIGELITVTEIAERAIGGLKLTVREVNENLGRDIAAASALSDQLKKQLGEGDNVLRRLSKIVAAARPSGEQQPVSAAQANAAAAQAFAERRRQNGLAA